MSWCTTKFGSLMETQYLGSENSQDIHSSMLSKIAPNFPMSAILGVVPFLFKKKNVILRMHWHIVMKFGMCLRHHALRVLKTFWGSATLWSEIIYFYIKKLACCLDSLDQEDPIFLVKITQIHFDKFFLLS